MEHSERVFIQFCEETSLHGWNFILKRRIKSLHCAFWFMTICSALGLGTVLITWNTQEFLEATVDFNTLSMTTPMTEVFFPAIYVINKNIHTRKSFANIYYAPDGMCKEN